MRWDLLHLQKILSDVLGTLKCCEFQWSLLPFTLLPLGFYVNRTSGEGLGLLELILRSAHLATEIQKIIVIKQSVQQQRVGPQYKSLFFSNVGTSSSGAPLKCCPGPSYWDFCAF